MRPGAQSHIRRKHPSKKAHITHRLTKRAHWGWPAGAGTGDRPGSQGAARVARFYRAHKRARLARSQGPHVPASCQCRLSPQAASTPLAVSESDWQRARARARALPAAASGPWGGCESLRPGVGSSMRRIGGASGRRWPAGVFNLRLSFPSLSRPLLRARSGASRLGCGILQSARVEHRHIQVASGRSAAAESSTSNQ